jgi:uncharacterized membrane protein/protocatechuate 3,4-dioxygenase beta subunit
MNQKKLFMISFCNNCNHTRWFIAFVFAIIPIISFCELSAAGGIPKTPVFQSAQPVPVPTSITNHRILTNSASALLNKNKITINDLGDPGSISGSVMCPECGPGDVQVFAFDGYPDAGANILGQATTSVSGLFTIDNLPFDTSIWIYAWADNSQQWDAIPDCDDYIGLYTLNPVILSFAQQDLTGVAITLDTTESCFTIHGHISAYDGTAVAGTSVQLISPDDPNFVYAETQTDDQGDYLICRLPFGFSQGVYRLVARAQGFAKQYFNNTYYFYDSAIIPINCGTILDNYNFTLKQGNSISGIVVKENNGQPIEGVWVEATEFYSGRWVNATATRADGRYIIDFLPPGAYRIRAFVTGDYSGEWYSNTYNREDAAIVNAADGIEVSNINFSLSVGGTISGRVLQNTGGQPLAGALVSASDYDSGEWRSDTLTREDGSYIIHGLPAGSYRVAASGSDYARTYYAAAFDYDAAMPVAVAAGIDTPNINFSLTPSGSISGEIKDSNGQAITGAQVIAYSYSSQRWITHVWTQPDGSYTVKDLAEGRYLIQVRSYGSYYIPQFYNNSYFYEDSTAVEVLAGAGTTNIDFNLELGGRISGVVRRAFDGQPISGVLVELFSYDTGRYFTTSITDAGGFYSIEGISAGSYKVRARVRHAGTEAAGQWYQNMYEKDSATPVEVTAGAETASVDFNLAPGGSITGAVQRDTDGQPIQGLQVIAFDEDTEQWVNDAETLADGSYTIWGLPQGSYKVFAESPAYAREYYKDVYDFDSATTVPVTAGSDTSEINLSLAIGGSISGTVSADADGKPIENIYVIALDYFTGRGMNSANTQADGSYVIRALPAGIYRVQVENDRLNYIEEYYNNAPDYDTAMMVEVTIGADTPNIDFSLAMGGSISGTVTRDADDQPISGVLVEAFDYYTGREIDNAETQADGGYTIWGLPASSYRLRTRVTESGTGCAGEWYDNTTIESKATAVIVQAGNDTSNTDFALASGGSISGTIRSDADGHAIEGAYIVAFNYDSGQWINDAETQEDGSYTIWGLSPGRYRVRVGDYGTGFIGEYYNNTYNFDGATAVEVTAGADTQNIDFGLAVASTITGRVTDGNGQPLSEICVGAVDQQCSGAWFWTSTDTNGNYSILVPGGKSFYLLSDPSCSNQQYLFEWWDSDSGTVDCNEAEDIEVITGQSTTGIDFSLDRGGTLSGQVVDAAGQPLAQVCVGAVDQKCNGSWYGTMTDANGNYSIVVPAGNLYVRADSLCSDQNYTAQWWNTASGTNYCTEAAAVDVMVGQTITGINFSLQEGGILSGRVTSENGQPLEGVCVDAFDLCNGNRLGGAQTNLDGSYTIEGLPSGGSFYIRTNVLCSHPLCELNYIDEWWTADGGSVTCNTVEGIPVMAGQPVPGIDFSLQEGNVISGRVTGSNGLPLANVSVDAVDRKCNGTWYGGKNTDEDGNYCIIVPEGSFYIRSATNTKYPDQWWGSAGVTTDCDEAVAVDILAGQTTTGIDLSLQEGATISGRVTSDTGQPLADINVGAVDQKCDGDWYWTSTDANGNYSILVPGGKIFYLYADPPCSSQNYLREWRDSGSGSIDCNAAEAVEVAAGQTTAGMDFSLREGAIISGRITDIHDQPLADVCVDAIDQQCDGTWYGGSVDGNGNYCIVVPEGSFYVRINPACGRVNYIMQWWNNGSGTTDCSGAEAVDVTIGQWADGVDFSLQEGGMISGRITTADGQPVALQVVASDFISGSWLSDTRIAEEDEGFYTIRGLPSGNYKVNVNTQGTRYIREYYNNTYVDTSAASVPVAVGATTPDIDFNIEVGGSISGIVTRTADGEPIAGMQVVAYDFTSGRWQSDARTLQDGTYTIQGLPAGIYRVVVDPSGTDYIREYYNGTYDDTYDYYITAPVSVTVGITTPGIDFSLEIGGRISGMVARASDGTPVAGLWVGANDNVKGRWGNSVKTNKDGSYIIRGLPPGNYRVEVDPSNTDYIREYYSSTYDYSSAASVPVTAGITTPGIDFLLETGGRISGIVTRASDGNPVAGLMVSANDFAASRWGSSAKTNNDGSYLIRGLPAGNYRVSISTYGTEYASEYYNDTYDHRSAAQVPVTADVTTPDINFSLELSGSISGTVIRDADNQPIPYIGVYAIDIASGTLRNSACTNADGTYTITNLPPGTYRVFAYAYDCVSGNFTEYASEYYDNSYDKDSATPVPVNPGEDTPDISFSLGIGGSISGVVKREIDGQPISNVYVLALNPAIANWMEDYELKYAVTQTDGTYTIKGLLEKDYLVYVYTFGTDYTAEWYDNTFYKKTALPVAVTLGNDSAEINFNLKFKSHEALSVLSTSPANGAQGIPVNTVVNATFSAPVDDSTINTDTFYISDTSGTSVPGTIVFDYTSDTATFTPSAPLLVNTTYTATLTTQISDIDGNSLGENYSWSFTTTNDVTTSTSVPDTTSTIGESTTTSSAPSSTTSSAETSTTTTTIDLTSGLVAYYPFSGNADDASGNGNNGVVSGAILSTDRYGNPNSAYSFDGSDVITIPNSSSLNPAIISVSCWVNFARLAYGGGYSGTDSQFIICKGGDRTTGAYIISQSGSSATSHSLGFTIAPFYNLWYVSSPVPLETNRWYYIAATYDGQLLRLYLDGNLLNSNDVGSIPVGNDSPLYLGYDDVSGFPYHLSGQMDEVRIFNRALSAGEIALLYNEVTTTTTTIEGSSTSTTLISETTSTSTIVSVSTSTTSTSVPDTTSTIVESTTTSSAPSSTTSSTETSTTTTLYPNLRITNVDMKSACGSLEQIDIKWLESNDGPGRAEGGWVDKLYLSTDEVLDSQDTLLGEFSFSGGLDAETQRWQSAVVEMPLKPLGTYYVIFEIDSNNAINETNENDNLLVKQIDYLMVKQLTVAPDQVTVQLNPGEPISGEVDIINLGDTPLTGITTSIEGGVSNITVQVNSPPSLNGLSIQKLGYTISASDESVTQASTLVRFTSAEGMDAALTFKISVNPRHPNLVANPGYLETTMVRGFQTMVEFEVTNTGAAPAVGLQVLLPAADWLSLVTPDTIELLIPGETIKVGLSLKPSSTIPLGPYTGSLGISASNASLSVSFRFTAVSDKTGGLKITAKDEFTYFADNHPAVADAAVKLTNPYDGTLIAEGHTDANGQFAKTDLLEGYYNLEVSAVKHGTYHGYVLVTAGQVKELNVFLPRQLVTYTWKVVPVQTEDRYVVTLEAVFETHVPAPVITVDPLVLDLSKVTFDANGTATVNYTVSNHGLIGIQGTSIHFGTHPKYQVTPLNENIGEVPAMSSLIVPVTIKKVTIQQQAVRNNKIAVQPFAAENSETYPCLVEGSVYYYYVCGELRSGIIYTRLTTGPCAPSSPPPPPSATTSIGPTISQPPGISQPQPCPGGPSNTTTTIPCQITNVTASPSVVYGNEFVTLTATTDGTGEITWSGDPIVQGKTGKNIVVQFDTPGERTIVATCGQSSRSVKITAAKAVVKSLAFNNDHGVLTDYDLNFAGAGGSRYNPYDNPEWNMSPPNIPITYTKGDIVKATVMVNVQPAGVLFDLEGDSSTAALDFKVFGIPSTGEDQPVDVTGAVNLPEQIGFIDSTITWRINNVGGAGGPSYDIGTFDPLRIYLTWDIPGFAGDPYGEPTIKRINWVCEKAEGATSPEEIADKLQATIISLQNFGQTTKNSKVGWELLDYKDAKADCIHQAQLMQYAVSMLGVSGVSVLQIHASVNGGAGCCTDYDPRVCSLHGPERLLFIFNTTDYGPLRNVFEGCCALSTENATYLYTITPALKENTDYDILMQLKAGGVIQKYYWDREGDPDEYYQPCELPDSVVPFP